MILQAYPVKDLGTNLIAKVLSKRIKRELILVFQKVVNCILTVELEKSKKNKKEASNRMAYLSNEKIKSLLSEK